MRIAIREQLAALVLFAVLLALAIVSIPTWIYVNKFVTGVESGGLTLTASLKASQVASELDLIQTTCITISTRILVQVALQSFYRGNVTADHWNSSIADLGSALNAGTGTASNLLQAVLWSRNATGNDTALLNITGVNIAPIKLPYPAANGSDIYLGEGSEGYPPMLYPNITYDVQQSPDPFDPSTNLTIARPFPEVRLDNTANGLLLGPMIINESYALMSLTIPIRQNTNTLNILGYLSIVAEATPLLNIMLSREGLDNSGVILLIGPQTAWNRFPRSTPASNATYTPPDSFKDVQVKFVLAPRAAPGHSTRHSERNFFTGEPETPFPVKDYDAVYQSFAKHQVSINNSSSLLDTHNEQGISVGVGWARPPTGLVNWTLIVEKDRSEVYTPVVTLRNILLGCVFGTAGLIILVIFPCAHLSVLPIRRLKAATAKSIAPPGYAEAFEDDMEFEDDERSPSGGVSHTSEKGMFAKVTRKIWNKAHKMMTPSEIDSDPRRRVFKIPGKVNDKRHFITDELTELTTTFNEMGDELLKQYTSLDEKVAERTRELELSKKAAEAANESKTLFIANISHELKTPLNGILGMCAVCMEEDDITRIKQSLKTLYKSGDLLLHLLEDLLSFSKNQIGQQLNLEQREFRLGDVRSQVLTIFDKQVREGKINFSVNFLSTNDEPDTSPDRTIVDHKLPAIGPQGTGRLKDMCLWGDQHRILQVLINLVSNSLKFTPPGGKVSVRIKCLGEVQQPDNESRSSSFSRSGSNRPGRSRHRVGSGSNQSTSSKGASRDFKGGTALSINPMEPKSASHIHVRERSLTPPPPGAKAYTFEFEVEDTGPGIPDHMQQRVFEPFVQGDLGLSKKFGGTGLGLSICQQLATLMGGNIELRSTIGVGTVFTMHIPLKYTKDRASSTASSSMKSRPPSVTSLVDNPDPNRNSLTQAKEASVSVIDKQPRLVGLSVPFFAANPTPSKPTSKEAQMKVIDRAMANKAEKGGKLRVLVADDNSTNIEVVSRMLKLEAIYDVTIAKDGQEAYDIVKASMENNDRFDVIFMDIQMPNLDGLQSTRLIRKMGYSAPIVALTAFSEESNVKECMESGMDEFLAKPIRRPALKQVLKKFATIPEEPENVSVTRKSTPEKLGQPSTRDEGPSDVQGRHATPPVSSSNTPVQGAHRTPSDVPIPAASMPSTINPSTSPNLNT